MIFPPLTTSSVYGEYGTPAPQEIDHLHLKACQFFSIDKRDQYFDKSGEDITDVIMAALRDKDCDHSTTAKILENFFELGTEGIYNLNLICRGARLPSITNIADEVIRLLDEQRITLTQHYACPKIRMTAKEIGPGSDADIAFRKFIGEIEPLSSIPIAVVNIIADYSSLHKKFTYYLGTMSGIVDRFESDCIEASAQGKLPLLNLVLKENFDLHNEAITIVDANLKGLKLAGLKLIPDVPLILINPNLDGTDLSDAEFSNVTIINAKMEGTNLTRVKFNAVTILDTTIGPKAKLDGAEIAHSSFTGGKITSCSSLLDTQVKYSKFSEFPIHTRKISRDTTFEQVTRTNSPVVATKEKALKK